MNLFASQTKKSQDMKDSLKKRYKDSHISILSLSVLTGINQRLIQRILVHGQEARVSEYLVLNAALELIENFRTSTGNKLKINVWSYDHFDKWLKRKATFNEERV